MSKSLAARLTIDLGAVVANWQALDALSAPGCETAAVVKADAYGCGAGVVGPALAAAGCQTFFVAMPEEAFALRDALGPGPAIHVFAGLGGDLAEAKAMAELDIRPVLNSVEQASFAATSAAKFGGFSASLQVDTGMNRLGMEEDEVVFWLRDPQAALADGMLDVGMVISHMGCADDPDHPLNAEQRACFDRISAGTQAVQMKRSLSATAGLLLGNAYHYDMVRPGIGLFGGLPFDGGRPAVVLEAPILQIRDVRPGESIGYAASWTANRPSRIATVPVGYADGLIRALSAGAVGYVSGWAAPFAGRVSMDLITLDVTDCPCAPGDMVEILGRNQSIDDLAKSAGTIGHEILTSLGSRYERVYIGA
jgi:alanine racemase